MVTMLPRLQQGRKTPSHARTSIAASGTSIRMDWKQRHPDHIGLFFNCRTSLVAQIRRHYPEAFLFEGNRALFMRVDCPLPEDELRHGLALALTYHRRNI